MHIKNLTNSPYSLVNKDGESVMLPARGELDIEPHPMHVGHYRQVGYFEITESGQRQEQAPEPDPIEALRNEYEALAGKPADGRWSTKKLSAEIDALLES